MTPTSVPRAALRRDGRVAETVAHVRSAPPRRAMRLRSGSEVRCERAMGIAARDHDAGGGGGKGEAWDAFVAHWPGVVMTVDAADRVTSVNRSTSFVHEKSDLGRDLFTLVPRDGHAALRDALAAARGPTATVNPRFSLRPGGRSGPRYDFQLIPLTHDALALVTVDTSPASSFEDDDFGHERSPSPPGPAKNHLRLLADASRAFSEATSEYDQLLSVIARRLGDLLGDLCTIRAVSEDGTMLETGVVHHGDPEIISWAQALLSQHPQRVGEGLMGRVAASGEPVFLPNVFTAGFAATIAPQYREILERLEVRSVIAVPMVCRAKVVGVATLLRCTPQSPYTEDDLNLVRSLADHAAPPSPTRVRTPPSALPVPRSSARTKRFTSPRLRIGSCSKRAPCRWSFPTCRRSRSF